jgi:predicted MPP superfamily phosphohydrolase
MRIQSFIFVLFLFFFIVIIDLYTYRGISRLYQNLAIRQQQVIFYSFWGVTLVALIWLTIILLRFNSLPYDRMYQIIMLFLGFFVLFYVPKLFFNGFQIIRDLGFLLGKGFSLGLNEGSTLSETVRRISRSDFLLQIGIIISIIPFLSIVYGIGFGRYNYKVEDVKLNFPDLPEAFRGVKIIQISDMHLGSMAGNPDKLMKAVKLINKQEADYVLFTGDIVNNTASELTDFIPILQKIEAKEGKYSILGNHDYGEYFNWESEEARQQNMNELYAYHRDAGFTLLRNESVILEKNGEKIGLAGVENWGLPPFPQYGDLLKAYSGVKDLPFKILMSHDPSHWDAEVTPQTDFDLTLSGHTHGMQFAIRIPGWRWSPVKMKYPRWGGLYQKDDQYLYVNIGLGFIAFPGRVGTPPEITLFTLN